MTTLPVPPALSEPPGEAPGFATEAAPAGPVELFAGWLREAVEAGEPEPHAMTLATVDADGHPSAHVLRAEPVEFWQGRRDRDRDHERLAYDRDGAAGWKRGRLWP
ncbi:pyridoxine 5'-phosphate oxidase C-terminal domain-containing protein [Streptomyces sp. MS19]|uniref:pyridoxine 5'-phosphate oxidase C-terminal domain-containing protein n=1 Tax=Streptomyces sp. MS19 TaxID=3385972 RepID=UPI0039A3DAAD